MNKKIIICTLIFILSGMMIYSYLTVPAVQEKVASYTEEDFQEENIYSDLEAVSERLNEEILKGSEEFTIYLKDLDVDAINAVNESLDGVFGSGATYQQVGIVGNTYKKVKITINRTANYYALQAYLHQQPIPESEQKAQRLYEVIQSILGSCLADGMSDYEKELALHDYLVTHCKYSENTLQSAESDVYRAYGALVNQDAVCNGYAEALQLLFMCAGIQSQFVIGKADGVDHAWNLVCLDGTWYHLDATWNDPVPDQGSDMVHPYFNVTDEIMEKKHKWNRENYPAAHDMNDNYYIQEQAYFHNFEEYKQAAYDKMVHNGISRYEAVIESYVENEDEMQFLFEGNSRYESVSWQTFSEGQYVVLVLNAE